jgi:group II intron reverse transcriptase/maturase
MQTAETIEGLIREHGKKGAPLERVYRLLYNPDFYLRAYGKLYRNDGAMTPGVTEETVDEMSQEKIGAIIEAIRYERYRWTPAKRIYIPKKSGKLRPLGLPIWSDKLVQEVVRNILTAYYEPQFSEHSHGFRPQRGCHTALREIWGKWTGVVWFIEGDISGCFDNIHHAVLLDILREGIYDERFIRLISNMLSAGYLEDWRHNATLSGTPQGGVISPILANIYLDKLDRFVTEQLIPKWTRGAVRRDNQEYNALLHRAEYLRKKGKYEEAKAIKQQAMRLPSMDVNDPNFRRLRYVRYADDFLLGFTGTKAEAEQIKEEIRVFLQDTLKLELSQAKTLVTHARTEAAHFLGYEIQTMQAGSQRGRDKRRSLNGKTGLRVPHRVIEEKCQGYTENGKPRHRKELTNDSDFTIIATYQAEFRGIVEYYQMAYNLIMLDKLKWIMETSLVKTLANKHKTTATAIYRKYGAKATIKGRTYKVLQAVVERPGKEPLVATWGGIPLIWSLKAQLDDQPKRIWGSRTELEKRLLANECEYCGSTENIEVHHIRALKDLNRHKGRELPEWMKLMAARKRKTMVVCRTCHQDITYGRPMRNTPSVAGFMRSPRTWQMSSLRKQLTTSESRMR